MNHPQTSEVSGGGGGGLGLEGLGFQMSEYSSHLMSLNDAKFSEFFQKFCIKPHLTYFQPFTISEQKPIEYPNLQTGTLYNSPCS